MARPLDRPFVGRLGELERLLSLLGAAATGEPGFAVVSGDAGVGKTSLLEELMARATASGHTVLVGSCVQVGDFGLPYVPIIDALRSVEATTDGAALLRQEAARRPILGRLLPQLVAFDARSLPLGDGLAQVQLFEAVHGILVALSDRAPLLFVVEDAHWADRSTRDLLAFLARTMRVGRVTVILSYRSDDVHRRHPLRPLLAELARRPDIERVDLTPFSRAELAELLASARSGAIDAQLLERVFLRSEGNAFFAEELLRAADNRGTLPGTTDLPVALADVLLDRIDSLSAEARTTLRVAAVAGRRAPHDLLVQAAEANPAVTEDALREAVESGLLVTDGNTYAFRHALLQEAVYGDLLPGERVRLHGRFAELLAKGAGDVAEERLGPGVRTAELAHHRLASHDLAGAFEALVDAADQAENLAAPSEALRHLEQALELVPQLGDQPELDLLARAADLAAAAGDVDRAVAHARTAVTASDATGDACARSTARERLARLMMEASLAAADVAAEAVALLPVDKTVARARALATWSRTIMRKEPARADELLTEAIDAANAAGADSITTDALVTRALMLRWATMPGAANEQQANSLLAEAVKRAAADPCGLSTHMRALRFQSALFLEQGRTDDALAAASTGVALSEKAGLIWSSYGLDLRLLQGWALAAQGHWDDVLRASLDAAYAPTSPGRVLATLALAVLVGRGDPAADGLLARLRGTGDSYAEVQLDLCQIDLLMQGGRYAEALAIAEHTMPEIRHHGETESLLLAARATSALAELASAARSAGDAALADHYAADAADYAEVAVGNASMRAGRPPAIVLWSEWAAAEAARAAGHDSASRWGDVLALAEAAGRVQDTARASLRAAEAALDAGDRGPSTVEALVRAIRISDELGAAPLRARAEDVARRSRLETEAGLSVGAPSAPSSTLTAREAEVLALLAAGLTNRLIGRELFISEKTASVHVSNIIGKLGASGRTEAIVIARRRGLLSS